VNELSRVVKNSETVNSERGSSCLVAVWHVEKNGKA